MIISLDISPFQLPTDLTRTLQRLLLQTLKFRRSTNYVLQECVTMVSKQT